MFIRLIMSFIFQENVMLTKLDTMGGEGRVAGERELESSKIGTNTYVQINEWTKIEQNEMNEEKKN